jgi:hypothetical protein
MSAAITRRDLMLGATILAAGVPLGSAMSASAQTADSERTNHAVLVAVTEYPHLPPSARLVGPNNDAQLVYEYLMNSAPISFAPENVTLLADGLENAIPPDRATIGRTLDDLASRVKNGDFVYLHFSGHGTQQPAMDPSIEPDGLDEIFLPRDTGQWVDRTKGVPNALIDKEVRDHMQAIRDKGAFIWVVFDCCNSGTMTRAVGLTDGEEVERRIPPAVLGIPDEVMAEAAAQGEASRGTSGPVQRQNALGLVTTESAAEAPAPGGMVAFFASQTTETTPEMPLPRGAADAKRLGLFTFTLYSKLAENQAVTYRQLGQAILQTYSANNRTRPTPLFEGELDRPVFGMSEADRIAQWAIKVDGNGLEIPAGMLHRLSPGAKLAVLASPGTPLDQTLGYVEVTAARNLASRIVPVAHEGLPAIAVADIPQGAYARLSEVSIGFELVVARPPDEAKQFPAETGLLNVVLEKIAQDQQVPINLRLVGATEDADVKLAVMSEVDIGGLLASGAGELGRASLGVEPRIWLLPPSAELSLEDGRRAPSLSVAGASVEEIADKLAENLVTMFRATSLSRLSAASDFNSDEFTVNFRIKRDGTGDTEALLPGGVPVVHPDDQIHLEARNGSSRPIDINVLYIGSDYSIGHMYAERLHSGNEITVPLLAFTASSFGIERMVVVLSEAAPQTPVEDLSFLEQVGVRQQTRAAGVGPAGFSDLLRDVAGAPATRGAARIGDSSRAKGSVMIFPMENVPRG